MTIGNMTTSMQANDTVLMIGATSSLAQAIARTLAKRGYELVLCGRDENELELLASDLKTRYNVPCRITVADIMEPSFAAQHCIAQAGRFNHMVLAIGDIGTGNPDDLAAVANITAVNFIVPAQIASVAASHMAQQAGGTIAILSSVAGDRGRQSNYAYGSTKAALSTFASGLRNRYASQGVQVLTVKPGFTDTPMTWGMKSPLIASREYVAAQIVTAMEKGKDIVYVPWFWRLIMGIIIHIPEALFKRMRL